MSDQEGSSPFQQFVCGLLDQLLGFGVNRGSCFVQNENGGICQYCAGKGKKLLFSGGETVAAFTYVTVITFVKLFGYLIGMNCPRSSLYFSITVPENRWGF